MKFYFLILGMLLPLASHTQNFITRWVFQQPSSTLTFNGVTEGEVVCRWTTSSNPTGGIHRFSNTNENIPIILAIPIPAGDTVTLSMEPTNLRRFFINGGYNNANRNELREVRQWGNVPWQSMEAAFSGCPNFNLIATDVPDLSRVKSMKQMFWFCKAFTPPFNIDLWDVSGVNDMESMFSEIASFNRDLSAWDLKALINAQGMFSNSEISCETYSRILKAWAENPNTADNVNFAFQRGAVYANTAASYRNALFTKGWRISMDNIAWPGNPCYNMALPVTFGNIRAAFRNGALQVNWATLTETNNEHFEIEASIDGINFTKIGSVLSRAAAGNSSVQLNYEFSNNISNTILVTWIGILLLCSAGFGTSHRKKSLFPLLALIAMSLSIAGCKKISPSPKDNNRSFYIRIKQVDMDGNFTHSKVVKAEIE
ncbi:DUF285 domain-containing protein [Niabella pedocola]|uniref:DUF285 domain-containing protein n=1 Tax=Niabella pedocola TaxID=1752077 RepID=A0ABS8PUM9_9BACT|nr:DUF285 domain-containing protein [Niabella pedocola]MCD2424777.1 DUF285 domain-containing protein [Niabella pedocola]